MSTLVTVGASAIFLGGIETVTRVTAVGAVLTVLGASLVV
jgi:hypothetical protein